MPDDGPTPEQQADYLVRKLEQTIRDNRTVRGMSFATWQALAREEIINALRASRRQVLVNDRTTNRLVLATAATMVTAGFWGAVLAVDRSYGGAAALALAAMAVLLLAALGDWALKKLAGGWAKAKREERLTHIEDLDRRIKRMEADMKKKENRLKDRMDEMGPL